VGPKWNAACEWIHPFSTPPYIWIIPGRDVVSIIFK
jgi:hypothetical protein